LRLQAACKGSFIQSFVEHYLTELIDEPKAAGDKPPPWWRRHNRLFWILIGVTAAAVILCCTYIYLIGNVRQVEVTPEYLGGARPPKGSTGALNILLVGSDQQEIKNGGNAGERTDTIMLVHLSADRNEAAIVSFPRDSMVRLPACRSREGFPGQRPHVGMINSSFNYGIGCTWKTIESLTGIHIDHFVQLDFGGFRGIVDAIGGVDICIPEAIKDRYAQLNLPAGWQTLHGEQALAYVRARHSIGDGTDIGRIQRQQYFISAMARKAVGREILLHPARLLGLLNAATRSFTTDAGLTPAVMRDLALAAIRLSFDDIRFFTTPWRYSITSPGRVEWRQGSARKLFRLIAADQPLTDFDVGSGEPVTLGPAVSDKPADTASQIQTATCSVGVQVGANR
jgi:LCP family protein required for cell wall assembly